jgi:putative two-component system response regulator
MNGGKQEGSSDRTTPEVMTKAQAGREIERLKDMYPVVQLLDQNQLESEHYCLLLGQNCPCMRKVCEEVIESGGERTELLGIGDENHSATARYVNVEGTPSVILTAMPLAYGENQSDADLLYRDALTGVYNRRYYEDMLHHQPVFAGVAVIDIDDFKMVNDTLGHHAGDIAIKTIAQTINSCIRETDQLVRYGGDEFVLVLNSIESEDFKNKLRRIADCVSSSRVPDYEHLNLTVSIGGVQAAGRPVEQAVRQADNLMYRAKTHHDTVVTDVDAETAPEYSKPLLLIVDDSELNREILREMLTDDYDILEASGGKEGIDLIERHGANISLVLLDIMMPGVNGFDVLSRMVRNGWIDDVPVIMISSEDSDDVVLRAYELGASDYVSRPFDMRVVRQRVSNVMRLYAKQRRLTTLLSQQFYERERDSRMLVDIMGGAMELRNGESGPHVLHVRRLTEILLERLVQKTDRYSINSSERSIISTASVLHDIGKISIPDNILNKPGKLTEEEFAIMKTHTTLGAAMLETMGWYHEDSPLVVAARDICRWHHERWDGGGYPDGLKGDEIPISAQVVSVADVYDALTADRVYKKAVPHDRAMEMIMNGECGKFNPLLLECLIDVQERIKTELDEPDVTPPYLNER